MMVIAEGRQSMLMIKKLLILSLLVFSSFDLEANREYNFTSGAYQGAYVLGVEAIAHDNYPLFISSGYTPDEAYPVKQLNLIQYINLIDFPADRNIRMNLYLGILYNPSKKVFLRLPNRYPRAYYSPTALRYTLGIELKHQMASKLAWSVHYAFLDSEIHPFFLEKDHRIFKRIGSYGFSIYLKSY